MTLPKKALKLKWIDAAEQHVWFAADQHVWFRELDGNFSVFSKISNSQFTF
jgi:hypothetical protein